MIEYELHLVGKTLYMYEGSVLIKGKRLDKVGGSWSGHVEATIELIKRTIKKRMYTPHRTEVTIRICHLDWALDEYTRRALEKYSSEMGVKLGYDIYYARK